MSNRRRPPSPTCVRGARRSSPRAGSIWWSCPRTNRTCAGTGTTDAGTRKGGAPDGRPDRRLAATGRVVTDRWFNRCLPAGRRRAFAYPPPPIRQVRTTHLPDRTFCCEPLVKPPFLPPDPRQEREKPPPPRPASRARPPPPPPGIRTRPVNTPEGRVRKMIPPRSAVPADRKCLRLLHYPASVRQGQYPCAGSEGIFLSFRGISPGGRGENPTTAARRLPKGRRAPDP